MDYKELLAEARAIHLAMYRGCVTYEEAQLKAKPLLEVINAKAIKIAKKYEVKPRPIKFQDLGRTF